MAEETAVYQLVDCFTFFNEEDLLRLRLTYLAPVVDYFVISEGNLTHSGNSKPFHIAGWLKDEEHWIQEFKNKISYVPADLTAVKAPMKEETPTTYDPSDGAWILENAQRNALQAGYVRLQKQGRIKEDSAIVISDLDEIYSVSLGQHIKETIALHSHLLNVVTHNFFYYYLNCQNVGPEKYWKGSVVTTYEYARQVAPQKLRDARNNIAHHYSDYPAWHFSFMGGPEQVQKKIEAFAHREFNNQDVHKNIRQSIENKEDVFGRAGVHFEVLDFNSSNVYDESLKEIVENDNTFKEWLLR